MAGPLSSANREIREAERLEQERKLARLKRPRLMTDLLLTELEELNLDDVLIVPEHVRPRLIALRESVREWPEIESRYGRRLQPGVRTSELIETIFAVQEALTPPRSKAALDDEELLALNHDSGWPFEP